MGTPIKGKTYSMAPTPEGEEHPNIMVTDWIPQRKPLTEEEIYKLLGYDNQHGVVPGYAMSFVRAVEAAHGIGENK